MNTKDGKQRKNQCEDIEALPLPPCEPVYTPIKTIRIYPDGRGFDENNNFIGYVTIDNPIRQQPTPSKIDL